MRCDEARRRLRAQAWDHEASRHLESCPACFAALEAADPLTGALRGARPDDLPVPAALQAAVLARLHPRLALSRAALSVVAVLAAAALELLIGVEPARLAGLSVIAGNLADGLAGALAPLLAVRSALFGQPVALTAFSAVTAVACGLWLRLAARPPAWRSAR